MYSLSPEGNTRMEARGNSSHGGAGQVEGRGVAITAKKAKQRIERRDSLDTGERQQQWQEKCTGKKLVDVKRNLQSER